MKQLNTLGQDDIKPIPSDMKREDIIRHINQIGDVFTLSMKAILEDAFETIAEYPVEIIPHTINGYQRFLDTITKGSSGRIIAGFIIRFKCLLQVELGDEVLRRLEHELISMSANDILAAESGQGYKDGMSLWKIAHPDLGDVQPPSEFDVLVTYLLLLQIKNLLIRANAQREIDAGQPKK
ncbi:hypothetical protein ACGLE7_000834 [Escherichia coli]|nr:hypothetical protein [Salmonella enterica]HCJ8476922.1 hypothetical protein [Escherichia coli]HCJ9458601.1 hypothetical protein [Escherichia coli]